MAYGGFRFSRWTCRHRKIITTFVARKKPVKLNQSDYEAIANAIVDKTNGSIEINMSSEIDKATRNRLTEVEKVNGELVKACKQLVKSQKAIANAVSDFKTISTSARDELKASMNDLATAKTGLWLSKRPKSINLSSKSKKWQKTKIRPCIKGVMI